MLLPCCAMVCYVMLCYGEVDLPDRSIGITCITFILQPRDLQ
jgi:hypothetical protein